MILDIFKEEDRLTVAAILVKNGYCVKQSKRRRPNTKTAYIYYLEAVKMASDDKEAENEG